MPKLNGCSTNVDVIEKGSTTETGGPLNGTDKRTVHIHNMHNSTLEYIHVNTMDMYIYMCAMHMIFHVLSCTGDKETASIWLNISRIYRLMAGISKYMSIAKESQHMHR